MPAVVLWSCVPSFCPLSRFACGASLANMPLFRILRAFLARFGGFVWVCLSWRFLWLVRSLCACEVRWLYDLWRVCLRFSYVLPLVLSYLPLCFLFFAFLLVSLHCLLSCFALVVFCLSSCLVFALFVGCCLLFPYGLYAKRKGAKVLLLASSLVLLWVC